MGYSIGRDFVMRLGEQGFEPDLLFLGNDRVRQMRDSHCDGPASLVIEVLQAGNQEQERVLKRRAYAAGGVPEYWIVDPFNKVIEFLVLNKDGSYSPVAIRFDQFISWSPEAKFEWYGGGPRIGGLEGTRRMLGMLLMTFGLTESVNLIEPNRWVQALQDFMAGDRRWLDSDDWYETVDSIDSKTLEKN